MIDIREGLTFNDVLLVPQYSEVSSRSAVDLSIKLGETRLMHPIIPANMQSVSGERMITAVIQSGGLGILHRFMPLEEQMEIISTLSRGTPSFLPRVGVSLGVQFADGFKAGQFHQVGVRIFCIDIAHGDSKHCVEMIQHLRQLPDSIIIAGNVATGSGARRLWEAGADVVKVGVGPGSLCTTRVETGNGVPQLTALMDVQKTQQELLARDKASRYPHEKKRSYPFIADGGLKTAGDIVKALCFADMVMMGNTFAGCEETPGETIKLDGRCYKRYVGSSTHKANHIEGIAALVPCTENYSTILIKLLEGIKSGCSYQGVDNLADLKDNPTFVKITSAGLIESHPHDVILT